MNSERDPYWDDLGVAWHAATDARHLAARLNVRLRAQALWAQGLMVIGLPVCAGLLALAAYTLYAGIAAHVWNFLTRGTALLILAALTANAVWVQRAKDRAACDSLAQMLNLAIARSQNLRRAASIGVAMCVVAAVFGVGGYFIRLRLNHAPGMSPLESLALLAAITAVLLGYLHFTAGDAGRLRYLKKVLAPESLHEGGEADPR